MKKQSKSRFKEESTAPNTFIPNSCPGRRYRTFCDILLENKDIKERGIVFIKGGEDDKYVSYKDLFASARQLLGYLQYSGITRGNELVFQLDDQYDFICVLWACIMGGIIPVPVSVANNDEHRLKSFNIYSILNCPYLITSRDNFTRLEKYARQADRVEELRAIARQTLFIETLVDNTRRLQLPGELQPSAPNDTALIQFSSGSTGKPKGVILTHENLLTNTEDLAARSQIALSDSYLSWMPLTHDMGLIGFHLNSLTAGINQYILNTGQFIRRPVSWLAKAAEYKATILASPNFGLHYFLLHFRPGMAQNWDLSRVRLIYNGAEPISIELCRRFLKTLAPFGLKSTTMYPSYGLAEATVGVTLPRETGELSALYLDRRQLNIGQPIKPVPPSDKNCIAFVEVGVPLKCCSLRIVDENNSPVEENAVGQVQIKGTNVTPGYYRDIKATGKAFSKDGWLNTGDLGFMHNGSLVVTGRLKDIIFVNGQNYYPHDLERLVHKVDGVESGRAAACGIFDPGSQKEEIFIFVVFRRSIEHFMPTALAVKKYLHKKLGVIIREVIPVKRIPKTTSGKIQRYKLREMVENGLFKAVIEELERFARHRSEPGTVKAPTDEIEPRLIELLKKIFPVKNLTVTSNLFELGVDSIRAFKLLHAIGEEFKIKLSLGDILDHPNIGTLSRYIAHGKRLDGIEPVPEWEDYPVSSEQKRLYSLQEIPDIDNAYNETFALEIHGNLDKKRLGQAFQRLIQYQESLRTSFFTNGGQLRQRIHSHLDVNIMYKEIERSALEPVVRELGKPFNGDDVPLIRACLLRIKDKRGIHIFLVCVHHIIFDGWSGDIFIKQFAACYEGKDLPPLKLRCRDFSVWQNRMIEKGLFRDAEKYWLSRFSRDIPGVNLIIDYPRPALQSFEGDRFHFNIDSGLTGKLTGCCTESRTTRYMLLLACLNVLFYKYTDQEDIVIGSPILGRPQGALKDIIGMFVNNLAMRNFPVGSRRFCDFLQEVKQDCLEAYANQDYPFELLVERLGLPRDTSRNPLFNIVFAWQDSEIQGVEIPGLSFTLRRFYNYTSKFDLIFFAWSREEEADIRFTVEYCSRLFRRHTIERLAGHFRQLLHQVVEMPEQVISEIDILTDEEKQRLLVEFNDTDAGYPAGKGIHELFEEQSTRTPDSTAVVDIERRAGQLQLTYHDLNRKSDRLAYSLIEKGVDANAIVGIMMERSVEMITGILGILKAGGAYLPIDPGYPQERVDFMLRDSHARILLNEESNRSGGDIAPRNTPACGCPSQEGNSLAYVIYTSGSTGTPKGVLVDHRGLVNMVWFHRKIFGENCRSRISQSASISFDAMAFETWPCLLAGAVLCIVEDEARLNPRKLKEWLILHQITISFQPTLMAQQLLQEQWPEKGTALKVLRTAGDKLDSYPLRLYPFRFYNLYGPTEDSVWTTWTDVPVAPSGDYKSPSIGKPVANKRVYILNRHLKLQPIGAAGELCIAGDGLARGYLNQPELTAKKFCPWNQGGLYPRPFAPGSRLYKTGDLARWLPEGNIEFLGRIDHQVKLRGFRVELGEIEAVINRHEAVSENVVMVKEDAAGDKKLIAYLVPLPGFGAEKPVAWGQEEQLSQWEMLFDENYNYIDPVVDDSFNTAGWNSSYTGEPIEPEAMKEWVESTVERICAFQPQQVFEIGAGTGLLLFRIAKTCKEYTASDFSAAAVRYLREVLGKQEHPWGNTDHVKILKQTADDFSNIKTRHFDMVIINSVVQYFPHLEYFINVIGKALDSVKPGGVIFVGDVRNYALLKAFHLSIQLHNAPASMSIDALNREVQKSMAEESELLISPEFFTALPARFPEKIEGVDIRFKRGRFHNELTRFRYDVIIHVGPGAGESPHAVFTVTRKYWQADRLDIAGVKEILTNRGPDVLELIEVPNGRIEDDMAVLEFLEGKETGNKVIGTVGKLKEIAEAGERKRGGVDPEDFWGLQNAGYEYKVEVIYSGPGKDRYYNVRLIRKDISFPVVSAGEVWVNSHCDYANYPLKVKLSGAFISSLRDYLQKKLPRYMVPSYFMQLDKLPLTPNGKFDREALPEPGMIRQVKDHYEPAGNELEKNLVNIWEQVLDIKGIGIKDNYFALGGDSIKAIQVVSRLRDLGLKMKVADLFKHPTIKEVSMYIETGDVRVSPGEECGEIEFTPIQEWFIRQKFPVKQQWNQSILLYRGKGFDAEAVKTVIDRLMAHHDALRIVLPGKEDKIIIKKVGEVKAGVEIIDLRGKANIEAHIENEGRRVQGNLDLYRGPLVACALFKTDNGDYLLIAIHHLAVDGVSWRILLEDFAVGYQQLMKDKPICFPGKTESYRRWSLALRKYARHRDVLKQLKFWQEICMGNTEESTPFEKEQEGKVKDIIEQKIQFNEVETAALFNEVHHAYNTGINDIFLGALSLAVKRWKGTAQVLINLEGHGREEVIGVDVSRTVGWFTSQYPVLLEVEEDLSEHIRGVKERLRSIPHKGIGYGLLWYCSDLPEAEKKLLEVRPRINFNYLGQFSEEMMGADFKLSGFMVGEPVNPKNRQTYPIIVNGFRLGSKLIFTVEGDKQRYHVNELEHFSQSFRNELIKIIRHCKNKKSVQYSPSDFDAKDLKNYELDEIMNLQI
ncbi:amino acid adenylation domain-containing protein [Acidobacteriota bacterium]